MDIRSQRERKGRAAGGDTTRAGSGANKDEFILCTQRLRASVLLLEPRYARDNMRVLCDCGRCTVHTLVACAEKAKSSKNE